MPESAPIESVDLVGVGLNATDTVLSLSAFPERGSKVEYARETVFPGGQVASTVAACQMWGLRTRYVGKLGDDDAARLHRGEFARLGVEARLIEVPQAASPKSLILVDATGERTVLCRRDERLTLQPQELCEEWITSARVLHVDGHDTAAATQAARWARAAGVLVSADLDELYTGVEALLGNVDYLITNHDFPTRLTGQADPRLALQTMAERFGCRVAATTLGPGGVLALDADGFHGTAAFDVPVTDTTGAGDIFRAGFLYGLLQGWPLCRQMEFACAAAAMNCMSVGARGGIEPVAVIEDFCKMTPRHPLPAFVPGTVVGP